MQYAEMLRKARFNPRERVTAGNVRAIVMTTEKYVAGHDPTFYHDLIRSLEKEFGLSEDSARRLFNPSHFALSGVQRISLTDTMKELYPDADILKFADKSPRGGAANYTLLYTDRTRVLDYVRKRTKKKQLVVIEFKRSRK